MVLLLPGSTKDSGRQCKGTFVCTYAHAHTTANEKGESKSDRNTILKV